MKVQEKAQSGERVAGQVTHSGRERRGKGLRPELIVAGIGRTERHQPDMLREKAWSLLESKVGEPSVDTTREARRLRRHEGRETER